MSGGEEGKTLEFTPTWIVAAVCTIIVALSLAMERLLHYGGKFLKKKDQKPLYEALQKVKEELMLLGFISLLLTVFQNVISKICVDHGVMDHLLPCKLSAQAEISNTSTTSTTTHWGTHFRKLVEETAEVEAEYCAKKSKVPLLSVEALHHLHIFIFVLAIVHVTFCVLTVVFGGMKIRQWKKWEDDIAKQNYDSQQFLKHNKKVSHVTHVRDHAFIKERFLGMGQNSVLMGWILSFLKQFYASVTKSDYVTLRLGFINTHCKSNPKFNFHKYMIRALEDDFRKVVGISWYLWIFVVIFLLMNVDGWHTYFWIAFLPFVLLLAVGTKLEHVITQLAHEVAEKHIAVEGDLVVTPSDEHFWFGKPRLVLFLIHFILFQNSFEIAFFFWIWIQYGFDSCIMGQVRFIVPRLVIGVFIQVLCSYSTLPLYAIITQMGSSFKKAIFEDNVQVKLVSWAEKGKKKNVLKAAAAAAEGSGSGSGAGTSSAQAGSHGSSGQASSHGGIASAFGIQMGKLGKKETKQEEKPEGE